MSEHPRRPFPPKAPLVEVFWGVLSQTNRTVGFLVDEDAEYVWVVPQLLDVSLDLNTPRLMCVEGDWRIRRATIGRLVLILPTDFGIDDPRANPVCVLGRALLTPSEVS